ncbi:MAG TPA: hypothetical protein VEI08_03080 [Candidatus Bathyarchaeia archaeon]|nr:hypothetical protein [Candidatus Bathyarchaeia archaeon]
MCRIRPGQACIGLRGDAQPGKREKQQERKNPDQELPPLFLRRDLMACP